MRIALFTDQGAHYRFPCFKAIDQASQDWGIVDFYIPDSNTGGLNILKGLGGLRSVRRIKNYTVTRSFFYQTHVVRACLSAKYDVVVLWGGINILTTWLAVLLSQVMAKRIVLWGHGYYGNEVLSVVRLRTLMYMGADYHLLYGEHGQRLLKKHLPSGRSDVIYNSLDVEEIRQHVDTCRELQKGDEWDLIFVGRITKVKNLGLLLDACEILKGQGLVLKILIVGDGKYLEALINSAESMGLSAWFDWKGACYDDKVLAQYFRKTKFCISPGNIGLMALHSLYNETAVITHGDMTAQMPEAEAVIDGVNGFLFRRLDASDLAFTIVRALSSDYLALTRECYASISDKYTPERQAVVFWRAMNEIS